MLFTPLYLLLALTSALSVVGVSLTNPLDNQLPLIGRINAPFSWTFAPDSFQSSTNSTLSYTTSTLPAWLEFNSDSQTFSGTPAAGDGGEPQITVTAHDSTSSASSQFTLCVTAAPAPTVDLSIPSQFYQGNPSLSSVFVIAANSALATGTPSLRVPPQWSFSIGFDGSTFQSTDNLYYGGLLSDGSALPDWINFDSNAITFDGVSPSDPQAVSLSLRGSDEQGYTGISLPFNLIVAAHELSASTTALPTINVTASTPFNFSLGSPDDFSGILVDGQPIQSSEIETLTVDVSQYSSWLRYDEPTRTLSGQPPSDLQAPGPVLPVALTAVFNQSIHTNVSLAVVSPYFTDPTLPPVVCNLGGQLHLDLVQYFAGKTDAGGANLSAAFNPSQASDYLSFDTTSAQLSGTIPTNLSATGADPTSKVPHISVSFTAYSYETHSTSHTSLEVVFSPSGDNDNRGGGHRLNNMSPAARARLALGLGISFGIIGSLVLSGILLALFRRCMRVGDTALVGEENWKGWSDSEKRWYGVGPANDDVEDGQGYGWTKEVDNAETLENKPVSELAAGGVPEQRRKPNYGGLSMQFRRISNQATRGSLQSPTTFMSKAEFVGKIRSTVRQFSDTYRRQIDTISRKSGLWRAKVIANTATNDAGSANLPVDVPPDTVFANRNPFDDHSLGQYADSLFTTSPSNSTGARSIPRRRADFTPMPSGRGLRSPDPAHVSKHHRISVDSVASNSSVMTHGAQAVVKKATRATSIRSVRSGKSVASSQLEPPSPYFPGKPRLVPFTSASRVPTIASGSNSGPKRVPSQSARVYKDDSGKSRTSQNSVDELAIGVQYVRALGEDGQNESVASPPPGLGRNAARTISRSTFSSLESSHHGHHATKDTEPVSRMLIRVNEKFKFKVPILPMERTVDQSELQARTPSGAPVPGFLFMNIKSGKNATVEFSGIPSSDDIGELNVGVYMKPTDRCVGRVIIEVVNRS